MKNKQMKEKILILALILALTVMGTPIRTMAAPDEQVETLQVTELQGEWETQSESIELTEPELLLEENVEPATVSETVEDTTEIPSELENEGTEITETVSEEEHTDVDRKENTWEKILTEQGTLTEQGSLTEQETFKASEQTTVEEILAPAQSVSRVMRKAATVSTISYESELTRFPADYQVLLQELHRVHPNWVFVAVTPGMNWNTAVEMESRSSLRSVECFCLMPSFAGKLLLSKRATDYQSLNGTYIVKDGNDWVSASKPAVAYYMDPRNFLTEKNIFQFETSAYNGSFHTLASVETVLKNTDLSNRKITYLDTSGRTVSTSITYGEALLSAGIQYGISPMLLAAKVRQETGGRLTDGSISGNFSYAGVSYRGYYNFYNIYSMGTNAQEGSAIAVGLTYAKGGSRGTETSYGRPWNSPVASINGGASYMADSYLKRGQNTIYFKKFNTVAVPYYYNQYMQNLYGAETEGRMTYSSYQECGILDSNFVFYIPVYPNMPVYHTPVTIQKSVTTGKATEGLNLRTGPSTAYPVAASIPSGGTVTVLGGMFTDIEESIVRQLNDPYWLQVSYGGRTGYVSADYIRMDADVVLTPGQTRQLSVRCADSVIYYETSNPAVATVNDSGVVTAVANGSCTIYALNGSGSRVDCVGISVQAVQTMVNVSTPVLVSVVNGVGGATFSWKPVGNAEGYYVYRKTPGGSWKRIASVNGRTVASYKDRTAVSGTTYTYTVRAFSENTLSGYDKTGKSLYYMSLPEGINVVNGVGGTTIKWNTVAGADGYAVYRKTTGTSWNRISTVSGGNTATYKDRTAVSGTTYTYTIRATFGNTLSGYDVNGGMVKYMSLPDGISAVNGVGGATIKWNPVNGAEGYAVYRKDGASSWKRIATVSGGGTVTYKDRTAVSGTTYGYTIRGISGSTLSGYDVTGGILYYMSVPALSGASGTENGITVWWKPVTGAQGYAIYRKTASSGWKRIGIVKGASVTSYLDGTAAYRTVYTYTVRATYGSTLSGYDVNGKSAQR